MKNKTIRSKAEDHVQECFNGKLIKCSAKRAGYDFRNKRNTVFVEVKGTSKKDLKEVQFRYFTDKEHQKAMECRKKKDKKYQIHLILGIGKEGHFVHYHVPGDVLSEAKRETIWSLPMSKIKNNLKTCKCTRGK